MAIWFIKPWYFYTISHPLCIGLQRIYALKTNNHEKKDTTTFRNDFSLTLYNVRISLLRWKWFPFSRKLILLLRFTIFLYIVQLLSIFHIYQQISNFKVVKNFISASEACVLQTIIGELKVFFRGARPTSSPGLFWLLFWLLQQKRGYFFYARAQLARALRSSSWL